MASITGRTSDIAWKALELQETCKSRMSVLDRTSAALREKGLVVDSTAIRAPWEQRTYSLCLQKRLPTNGSTSQERRGMMTMPSATDECI
jgi:hypothetical protein